MKIKLVPVLSDNYAYICYDETTKDAFVVDPAEADKVMKAVNELGLSVKYVLTTHHHADHAGGNSDLVRNFLKQSPPIDVVAGDDRVPELTKMVREGDSFSLGTMHVQVFSVPCHTTGHVLFLIRQPSDAPGPPPALFSGDTLFLGGCGRFFEGTADQMVNAMTKIRHMPDQTQVYCGHEYSVANLEFAAKVEPDNQVLADKLAWCRRQRESGQPTVPSTVAEEKQYNPFMRWAEATVQSAAGQTDPTKVMAAVREWKNSGTRPSL